MVLEENGEDKMVEKVTNEQVPDRIGERTLLNNTLIRKELDRSYSEKKLPPS